MFRTENSEDRSMSLVRSVETLSFDFLKKKEEPVRVDEGGNLVTSSTGSTLLPIHVVLY